MFAVRETFFFHIDAEFKCNPVELKHFIQRRRVNS